jgi:hypothetical protein
MGAASNLMSKFVAYVVNPLILLIFAAGFFWFIFGLTKMLWYIEEGGTPFDEGKSHMWWGLIGMFIMVSVAGFIMIINNTFDLGLNYSGGGTFTASPDMNRMGNVTAPANFFSN